MIDAIGATNYDKIDDAGQLELNIARVLLAQKMTWKTVDEEKLRYLIKRQIIIEISLIEERKMVRNKQQEIMQELREKQYEAEDKRAENAIGGTPKKGEDFDKSMTSSPLKGSPKKGGMGESETDTQSQMTGGTKSMGAGMLKGPAAMSGGGNIQAIIAAAGGAAKSGLTMGSKLKSKMDRGGVADAGAKS